MDPGAELTTSASASETTEGHATPPDHWVDAQFRHMDDDAVQFGRPRPRLKAAQPDPRSQGRPPSGLINGLKYRRDNNDWHRDSTAAKADAQQRPRAQSIGGLDRHPTPLDEDALPPDVDAADGDASSPSPPPQVTARTDFFAVYPPALPTSPSSLASTPPALATGLSSTSLAGAGSSRNSSYLERPSRSPSTPATTKLTLEPWATPAPVPFLFRRNTTGTSASTTGPPTRASLAQRTLSHGLITTLSPHLIDGVFYEARDSGVDDAFQDSIAKQAEAIRREREAKKKERARSGGAVVFDRVLVGNLVGEDHVNYVLMYNMLTGIRIGVRSFLVSPCTRVGRR
jgi:hypothetical protein